MGLPSHVKIVELSARDGLEGLQRFIPVDVRVELLNRAARHHTRGGECPAPDSYDFPGGMSEAAPWPSTML